MLLGNGNVTPTPKHSKMIVLEHQSIKHELFFRKYHNFLNLLLNISMSNDSHLVLLGQEIRIAHHSH